MSVSKIRDLRGQFERNYQTAFLRQHLKPPCFERDSLGHYHDARIEIAWEVLTLAHDLS